METSFSTDSVRFGELLRRQRFAAGLTQGDLARRAGLSARGISDLERGARRIPRKETVERLEQALQLGDAERASLRLAAQARPRKRLSAGAALRRWPALPVPVSALIGRQRETAEVIDLARLPDVRIITLAGPAGVGKTRLAMETGARLQAAGSFADGVAFVSLAAIPDSSLVLSTIGHAFGIQEMPRDSTAGLLREALHHKRLLLILDNVEHLVSAAPRLVDLLSDCPDLTLLTTSRVRLRIAGERLFSVLPFELPGRENQSTEQLLENDGIRLFVLRAQEAQDRFELNHQNAASVVGICRRLDGLPLAIELAAARIAVLEPEALLDRLVRRVPVLAEGGRDAPARQRTLRTAIAWSYELLDPALQRFFRSLTIFSGGFTLEGAEAIAGERAEIDTLDGLSSLIEQNLVYRLPATDGVARFGLLEAIRDFGLDELEASGDTFAISKRHCDYVLSFANAQRSRIDGPESAAALRQLDAEHDNCRAALAWSISNGQSESALRLVGLLWKFWLVRGHLREGRAWAAQVLERKGSASAFARFWASYGAAALALTQHDLPRTLDLCDQVQRTANETNNPIHKGLAYLPRALALQNAGDHDQATDLYRRALEIFLAHESESRRARYSVAFVQAHLGSIAALRGETREAASQNESALTRWRSLGDQWGMAIALLNLANLARTNRDYTEARRLYCESLRLFAELEDKPRMVGCIEQLASLLTDTGDAVRAARLVGAADGVRDAVIIPRLSAERQEWERVLLLLTRRLGPTGFGSSYEAGKRQTLSEVLVDASEGGDSAGRLHRPPAPPARQFGATLTNRETEVLQLVAEGRKDREIAATLFLSPRTVTTHITSIFNKLGVDSRTAAAVLALRLGLI